MTQRKKSNGSLMKNAILLILFMAPVILCAQNNKKNNNPPPPKPAPARPQPQVRTQPQAPATQPRTNTQPNRTLTNNAPRTTTNGSVGRVGGVNTGNQPGKVSTGTTANQPGKTTTAGRIPGKTGIGTGPVNNGKLGNTGHPPVGKPPIVTERKPTKPEAPPSVSSRPGYKTTNMQIGGKPAEVTRGPDHRIRDIHQPDFHIHQGVRGDRIVERRFPNNSRVVLVGRGHGFYERPYVRGYYQRTYIIGGRRYAYAYRQFYWHNQVYYRYAPAFYYHPGFYGWAYNPWPARATWAWGWGPSPWYGYYGYYFAPEPYYPSAPLWLTDYLLAENLKLAYDARLQSEEQSRPAVAANGEVVLSPEVKAQIAQEVKAQLEAEQQAASGPAGTAQPTGGETQPPPALLQKTFVVSSSLDVTAANGQECGLSAGDVLQRTSDPDASGNAVNVIVLASKKGDCAESSSASVQVADLQEMHNQFRQHIDTGLQTLAANQGKEGLPSAPDTGTTAGEVPPPSPDNVDKQVQSAQNDADQAEKQASSPGGN